MSNAVTVRDHLVLGAGLAGMAAAIGLGDRCTLLEREAKPGGLVRSHAIDVPGRGRFWFDHVLHLLYFSDPATERRVRDLVGDCLAPCPPTAFVETALGTTRYPFQMHLGDLPVEARVRCLADLIRAANKPEAEAPDLEQALLQSFGEAMCDAFLLPYNRKSWARPLTELKGVLAWTVTRPDLEQVLRGTMSEDPQFLPYNVDGHYTRPAPDAPLRGMEVLSRALAGKVTDLRTRHHVIAIDPANRRLRAATPQGEATFSYGQCLSTLPLPRLLTLVKGLPRDLSQGIAKLKSNRVWSVALCIDGAPPANAGHWRYYGDEDLCFTRLVFMHAFDPETAPAGAWSLLVEITQKSEDVLPPAASIIERAVADVLRAGVIDDAGSILASKAWCIDPAYVVFDRHSQDITDHAAAWLKDRDIHLLGRYGRWQYSSMSQVMRDGFALAQSLQGAD